MVAQIRNQVVQGGNLQALIADMAQRYGARPHPITDPGACRCEGGTGNCVGCASTPIFKNLHRNPGRRGRDGRPGIAVITPLYTGLTGSDGSGAIYVRRHDGTAQRFDSRYQLELVDFDVEDENGDGIFEPGEHVLIKRIRIRNTGGMPSPKCRIPVSVVASEWFIPAAGDEATALIPSSIAPNVAVTLESSVKVLIRPPALVPPHETSFSTREQLTIQAIMPWLNRSLPHFEYSRAIEIQYPIQMRGFRCLPTMAQGSISRFSYEVFNQSNKAIGSCVTSGRHIEVRVSFPVEYGSLQSAIGTWEDNVEHQIQEVPANQSITLQQTVRIADSAPSYTRARVQVILHISDPQPRPTEIYEIEQFHLQFQLSSNHVFNPASAFLLVTNAEATRSRVQAIQNFINESLNMLMDEWNVSLYGGLECLPESPDAPPVNALTMYKGKTIIFLGNSFKFFENGDRSVCELCDPIVLAEVCRYGTHCVFLDCAGHQAIKFLFRSIALPTHLTANTIRERQKRSNVFNAEGELRDSIRQNRIVGIRSAEIPVYTLPLRRHVFSISGPKAESKRIKKYLQYQLPQERFLLTVIEEAEGTILGHVAILDGLPYSIGIKATEQQSRDTFLSHFEAYMIIASLPISSRVSLAWLMPANETTSEPSPSPITSPLDFSSRAIYCALLLSLYTETRTLLHKVSQLNRLKIPTPSCDRRAFKDFLKVHLPTMSHLLVLRHDDAPTRDVETPPESIRWLLAYTLASCFPQKKRHTVGGAMLLHNPRRELRKFLVLAIDRFLFKPSNENDIGGANADLTKDIYSNARYLHFHRNMNGQRGMGNQILQVVSTFTRQSIHEFTRGQVSARDVVSRVEVCKKEEWDEQWRQIEERRMKVNKEKTRAWEVLQKMTLQSG